MKKINTTMLCLIIHSFIFIRLGHSTELHINFRDGTQKSISIEEIQKIAFNQISSVNLHNGSTQQLLQTFALFQNHPNPFNPTTTIQYKLPRSGKIQLKIFNIKGQLVRSFWKEHIKSGLYQFQWNGCNENGETVSTGVYIYQIHFQNQLLSRRMLLIK